MSRARGRKIARKVAYQVFVYALLIPVAIILATPLLWLVSTALKSDSQVAVWPPVWIPNPLEWSNFEQVFTRGHFGLYLKNTLTIAVLATIGSVSYTHLTLPTIYSV